jgi:hypothetical protein
VEEKQTELIAQIKKLTEQNEDLKAQVDALKANPPQMANQTLAQGKTKGFNEEDAAVLKAEIYTNIAKEVKRFEAMIEEKAKGTGKKPAYPTRRPQRTCKVAFAAPTPATSATTTTSAPNIIELAANLRTPPSGLLVEIEVN